MKGEKKKKQISSLTAHLKNLTETLTCIVNYILHNIIRRHKIKMLINIYMIVHLLQQFIQLLNGHMNIRIYRKRFLNK